jgi:predicted branched-subunit amino acid permease
MMIEQVKESDRALFRQGFARMLPLWTGAIPAGIAFGVAAHDAGLSPVESQLMSLVVFSASAQLNAVAQEHPSALLLIGTAIALNAQLLLIGLTAGRQLRMRPLERLATAWFLTDGAYAVATGHRRLRWPVLLGAGVSMYLGWNLGTAIGSAAGQAIPDPRRFGIDLVAPLTFLAVLVPALRGRTAWLVAAAAGATALLLLRIAPSGVAILAAGMVGGALGARLTREAR